MIVIVYDPPGQDAKTWELEEDSWTYGETVELERMFGGTRAEFFDAVKEGSDTARRMMLWAVRKRDEPDLELEDLNDLLISYLAFLKVVPKDEEGADPKAPEDSDPAAPEQPSSPTSSPSEPTSDSIPETSTP